MGATIIARRAIWTLHEASQRTQAQRTRKLLSPQTTRRTTAPVSWAGRTRTHRERQQVRAHMSGPSVPHMHVARSELSSRAPEAQEIRAHSTEQSSKIARVWDSPGPASCVALRWRRRWQRCWFYAFSRWGGPSDGMECANPRPRGAGSDRTPWAGPAWRLGSCTLGGGGR